MIKMLIKLQFTFVLIFSIAFSNTFGPYTADDNSHLDEF